MILIVFECDFFIVCTHEHMFTKFDLRAVLK